VLSTAWSTAATPAATPTAHQAPPVAPPMRPVMSLSIAQAPAQLAPGMPEHPTAQAAVAAAPTPSTPSPMGVHQRQEQSTPLRPHLPMLRQTLLLMQRRSRHLTLLRECLLLTPRMWACKVEGRFTPLSVGCARLADARLCLHPQGRIPVWLRGDASYSIYEIGSTSPPVLVCCNAVPCMHAQPGIEAACLGQHTACSAQKRACLFGVALCGLHTCGLA
jgi:hypothetical protein